MLWAAESPALRSWRALTEYRARRDPAVEVWHKWVWKTTGDMKVAYRS